MNLTLNLKLLNIIMLGKLFVTSELSTDLLVFVEETITHAPISES